MTAPLHLGSSAHARRPPALAALLREAMVPAMLADDADFRVAANALEEASEAITSSGSMAVAAEQVTSLAARQAEAGPLAGILVDLRNRWLTQALQDWAGQLAATQASEPDRAYATWRAALADAVTEFRFDLASRIAAAWVWPRRDNRVGPKDFARWADCADGGRWREARPLFSQLADEAALDARTRARAFAILGEIDAVVCADYVSARAACTTAERLAPADWRCVFTRARIAGEVQELEEADRLFETAAQSWPDIGNIYAEWAILRAKRGDFDGAQDVVARSSGCRTGTLHLIATQIDLCAYRELFPTGERRIEALVERACLLADLPEHASDAMLRAAQAFDANGKAEEAHRWYQRAEDAAPGFIRARIGHAYMFLAEKRVADAEVRFRRAVEIAPDAENAQWGIANLAAETRDWPGLIAAARRTLAVAPDWRPTVTDLLRNTAETVLGLSRDVAAARRFYDGVRDILGREYEGRYHNLLGHLAYWGSDFATAAAEYRKAIAAAEAKPDARFHGNLTLALENLYNADDTDDALLAEAIAHAQRAKEIDPATADYSVYLQRLEVRQAFIARHGHAAMKLAPDQYRLRFQLDSRLVPALVDTDAEGQGTLNAVFNARMEAFRRKITETFLFTLCSVRLRDDGTASSRLPAWRLEVGGTVVETGNVAAPATGEDLMDVLEPAILRHMPLLIGHAEAREVAGKLDSATSPEALGALALAARDIVARDGRLSLSEHGDRLRAAAANAAAPAPAVAESGIVQPDIELVIVTDAPAALTFEDLQASVHAATGVVTPHIGLLTDPAGTPGQWTLKTDPPLLTLSSTGRPSGLEAALAGAADRLLGRVALRWQLQQVRDSEPDLVDAVRATMDEATLLERLRTLLRDGHSILPLRQALEHFVLGSPLPAATREPALTVIPTEARSA